MQTTDKKIRLGIIGAGIIATESHLPALEHLKDKFQVTAICNRSLPKAESMAGRLGLERGMIWQDWRRFIDEAPVDAVLVCLPIELNYPVSEAAARAGKHVLCEKPSGASLAEARATLELSRKYGITYMVAEDCHYTPCFVKAARLVREGAIGKLVSISWSPLGFMPVDNKYARTEWRIHHAYPGGYLLDGGVHNIHVLQMIAGPVISVRAEARSVEPRLGELDHAFCLLNHASGVLSSLNLSWRAKDRGESPLKAFGTEGSLIVEWERIIKLDLEGKEEVIETGGEDAFQLEQLDFHRCITGGGEPSCTAESTARDVAVALALLESARGSGAAQVESVV